VIKDSQKCYSCLTRAFSKKSLMTASAENSEDGAIGFNKASFKLNF